MVFVQKKSKLIFFLLALGVLNVTFVAMPMKRKRSDYRGEKEIKRRKVRDGYPLHEAARRGDMKGVVAHSDPFEMTVRNRLKRTPIHEAIFSNLYQDEGKRAAIVSVLLIFLDHSRDFNKEEKSRILNALGKVTEDGIIEDTAVNVATERLMPGIVKMLMERGADMKMPDSQGRDFFEKLLRLFQENLSEEEKEKRQKILDLVPWGQRLLFYSIENLVTFSFQISS